MHLVLRLRGGGSTLSASEYRQGFAAGGQISQKIIRDTFPATAYNFDAGARLHVTIVSPAELSRLTGEPPLPSPVSIRTYLQQGIPWFDLYDEGIPVANNVAPNHLLAGVKSVQALLGERSVPTDTCCYCSTAAAFKLQPCGHMLCEACADGLPEHECPKLCRPVRSRKRVLGTEFAGDRAGWSAPEAGSADERIVTLSRCAAKGVVATFMLPAHRVSRLSSGTV